MNIFVVDNDPVKAAEQLCDQHVVKMPLENCQMLSAIFEDDYCGHPKSVFKHPCTLWLKESYDNVIWLIEHHSATLNQYTKRYNKVHKFNDSPEYFLDKANSSKLPRKGLTAFANATPYKDIEDVVLAYRTFYARDKVKFARWKYSPKPEWI